MVKLEQAIQSEHFGTPLQKAGLSVLYTAWWLKTIVSRQLKTFGLTHEQFNVLRILKGKHPQLMCIRDIGCRMIERSSNVPRIIDRLELKKLVDRSTSLEDKRETVITITAKGIDLLKEASASIDEVFKQAIIMKEEEAEALNVLLERMRESE